MRVAPAVAIAVWTLIAWGGRIGLLVGEAGPGAWLRIAGSLAVGLVTAFTLLAPRLAPVRRPVLMAFATFTGVLWTRSLYVNWVGSGSVPFKLVHTVLAVGFLALAVWAFSTARAAVPSRGDAVPGPDEGHGEEQAQGEATRLAQG